MLTYGCKRIDLKLCGSQSFPCNDDVTKESFSQVKKVKWNRRRPHPPRHDGKAKTHVTGKAKSILIPTYVSLCLKCLILDKN